MALSHSGNVVQVADVAGAAETPDGLIFETGGYILALFVQIHLGTLDDAAGMAAVARIAAPRYDHVVHGFSADLFRMVDRAVTEVFGRKSAGLVQDIDQDVGAVGRQTLTADRMIEQRLGEDPGLLLEFFRIGDGETGPAGVVDGDIFDLLRTHDRAAAAAAVAADIAVRIFHGDVGRRHSELTGGTDGQYADLLAESFAQGPDDFIVPLADEFGIFRDGGAVLVDVDASTMCLPSASLR